MTTAKFDDKILHSLSTSTTDHLERHHRDREDGQNPRQYQTKSRS